MPSRSMRSSSSRIAQLVGSDALDGADGALQHVVAPVELAGLLDGHQVAGLLDHAHDRGVAAGVGADAAQVALGHVEAGLAERDPVLGLGDGAGQAERVGLGSSLSRWKAMRWADLGPTPGRRPSSSMRSWTGPAYTATAAA